MSGDEVKKVIEVAYESSNFTGWNNNQTGTFNYTNIGEFLGRYGQNGRKNSPDQVLYKTFDIDKEFTNITIEFDMLEIDSWDMETFNVYINDTEVAAQRYSWRYDDNKDGYRHSIGYHGYWPDEVHKWKLQFIVETNGNLTLIKDNEKSDITVKKLNGGHKLKIGFGSALNQSLSDESWGVDNIRIYSVVGDDLKYRTYTERKNCRYCNHYRYRFLKNKILKKTLRKRCKNKLCILYKTDEENDGEFDYDPYEYFDDFNLDFYFYDKDKDGVRDDENNIDNAKFFNDFINNPDNYENDLLKYEDNRLEIEILANNLSGEEILENNLITLCINRNYSLDLLKILLTNLAKKMPVKFMTFTKDSNRLYYDYFLNDGISFVVKIRHLIGQISNKTELAELTKLHKFNNNEETIIYYTEVIKSLVDYSQQLNPPIRLHDLKSIFPNNFHNGDTVKPLLFMVADNYELFMHFLKYGSNIHELYRGYNVLHQLMYLNTDRYSDFKKVMVQCVTFGQVLPNTKTKLKTKLSIDARDHNGNTCLHIACQNYNKEQISFLISLGSNVNSLNHKKNNCLHKLTVRPKDKFDEIFNLLFVKNINLDATNDKGNTFLHMLYKEGKTVKGNRKLMAKIVTDKGASKNIKNHRGQDMSHIINVLL